MSLATLLDRNKAFAATDAVAKNPRIPWIPSQLSYVITCIDSRTEPAGFLGVHLGDATVQRTVGGRVTPAVLRDVAYISYLTETKTPTGPGGSWRSSTTPTAAQRSWPTRSCAGASPPAAASSKPNWPGCRPPTPPPPSAPTSKPWSPRPSCPPTSWSAGTSITPQPAPSTLSSSPPPSARADHPRLPSSAHPRGSQQHRAPGVVRRSAPTTDSQNRCGSHPAATNAA
jgi:hypothetical protein